MRVTLATIAGKTKVDVSLVSRVLNGDPKARLSDKKRHEILKVAKQLGYTPNRMARSLRTRRTNILAMLTPDISNPFHALLLRAVERTASTANYEVILCDVGNSPERFRSLVTKLSAGAVDGLIITTAQRSDPAIDWLRSRQTPYVLLNRKTDSPLDPYVEPNHYQAGWTGAEHLIELGHKRIAFLGGGPEDGTTYFREPGFRDALRYHQVDCIEEFVIPNLHDRWDAKKAVERLLALPTNKRPTGIFTPHTLLTDGAIAAVHFSGMRFPDDVSLVGYSASGNPDVTCLCVPTESMGLLATRYLLDRLDKRENGKKVDPLNATLAVNLVDRGTTKRIK